MRRQNDAVAAKMDVVPLRRRLLDWFDVHARDLPWRQSRDPYRVWVSEVMLQQTTVAAVIPYFHRFLERFPTLPDLAAATQADVLKLWEGLGYYRRARDLHAAAQLINERHAGQLPNDMDAARSLPGFGRYTANAVLSQAFDAKLPILEANSVRLLCRLFAIADDPKSSPVQKRLWELAEAILPNQRVGDFNQALMELGALVCTPNQPRCAECPLASLCQARLEDRIAEIPQKVARPKPEEVRETAVVLWRENEIFLVQRPAQGRWAHMWEFPRAVALAEQTPRVAAQNLLTDLGFDATLAGELTTIRHGVTRFRITLACLEATYRNGQFVDNAYPRGEWIHPNRLGEYPVSTPQRKLATLVQGLSEQRK
jgi:A/G-specific adenine glycosylase